jgi:hypothetical protein
MVTTTVSTTTITIQADINLGTTTQGTTTPDTTTGGVILIITKEVLTARTTLDIIRDTTTVLDSRMEIIKDIVQTTPTPISIILATKDTILKIPLTAHTMTGSTTKDITKDDTTIIRLSTAELLALRRIRINK